MNKIHVYEGNLKMSPTLHENSCLGLFCWFLMSNVIELTLHLLSALLMSGTSFWPRPTQMLPEVFMTLSVPAVSPGQ